MIEITTRPGELRRVLGAFLGAAIVVGGTIGVGILRTPGIVAGELGQPALILAVWLAGGLLAAMGASCYAELATALPRAGGPYVYARRAFGDFAGFAVGWGDWSVSVCGLALIALPTGEFAGEFIPAAAGHSHPIAVAAILVLALLNWFGLNLSANVQQFLSLAKVAGLLVIVVGGLAFAQPGSAIDSPLHSLAAPLVFAFTPLMSAMQLVSETYAGWNSNVYFAEEDHDAHRNVPRALFWGIFAITATYLAVNAALLFALPFDTLVASPLPVAEAARVLFGGASDRVVTLLAIVSLLGILNVTVMFTPRILFAMGRDRLLPLSLSRLNRSATPGLALLICIVPALVLAAGVPFETVFLMTAFLGVAVNASVYIAFFALRRREPDLPRPHRAFGYPWLPALVTIISLILLVGFVIANPKPSLYAIAMLAASYPVYRWLRSRD